LQPVILATTSRSLLFQAMTEEILENDGVLCRPSRSCVLCGQEGETAYGGLRDRLFAAPGVWSIRWCGGCRLAWLDPRPLAGEVSKLYREYYTHSQEGTNPHWVRDLKQFLKKATLRVWLGYSDSEPDLLQWLVGAALGMVPAVRDIVELSVMCLPGSSRGRLLDVGCGSGLFLSAMRQLGWEVWGLEPDPAAAEVVRRRGFPVVQAAVEEAELPAEGFDAVTMNHVIEHVIDPVAALVRCAQATRPGGSVVLTTPNWDSLLHQRFKASWRGLEPPRHLWIFTPGSLAACAERAGLAVKLVRTSARSASWIWQESRQIAHDGCAPGGSPSEATVLERLPGTWLQFKEDVARHFAQVGEEIVLVATRP
jgi:2-polyprenyl-3-methyl-5-hydroxy-6-metoxy-1,4-benzoquinol methylase